MQTDSVEWGNVTASSPRPVHSLPVNVSEVSSPTGLSLTDSTLTTSLEPETGRRLPNLLQQPQR